MTASRDIIAEVPLVSGGLCTLSTTGYGRAFVAFESPLVDEPASEPIEFTGAEAFELARDVLAGRTAPSAAVTSKLAAAVLVLLAAQAAS